MAAVVIPFAALAPVTLRARREAAHAAALGEFSARAQVCAGSVSSWLLERRSELLALAAGVSSDPIRAEETARRIRRLDEDSDFFAGIFVVAHQGGVVVSSAPALTTPEFSTAALRGATRRGRSGFFAIQRRLEAGYSSRLSLWRPGWPPSNSVVLLAVPLPGPDEKGALLIARVSGLGALLESLAPGDKRGVLLSDLGGLEAGYSSRLSLWRPGWPPSNPKASGRNFGSVHRPAGAGTDAHAPGGTESVVAWAPVPGTSWAVGVYESARTVYAPVRRLALWLGMWLGALLAAAILVGWRLALALTAPLAELKEFLERLPRAHPGERLPGDTRGELGSLRAAVNETAARLELGQQESEERLEELRSLSRQLNALCQADGGLMGSISLERIAAAVCGAATEGLGFARAILFVLQREQGVLRVAHARGIGAGGRQVFFLSPGLPRNPAFSLRAISRSRLPCVGRGVMIPLRVRVEEDQAGCQGRRCLASEAGGAHCYEVTQQIEDGTPDEEFLLRMGHAAVSLVGGHCSTCQRERLLGVLVADGLQAGGAILEQRCRGLTTLADHAAQAVQGAQRWSLSDQQLHARAEQLRILYDIAAATSAALRLDQVLQLILDRGLHYLKACYASVVLLGPGQAAGGADFQSANQMAGCNPAPLRGQSQEIRAVRGKDEMGLFARHSQLDRLLARSTAAAREACLIGSPQGLAERGIEWQGEDFQSALCAPLWAGEEPIGAICMVNRTDGAAFGQDDLYFISALARQASVGIHNARLYEEELAKRQELDRIRAQQSALLAQVFGVQERERRRVAMELHDGPTQTVSALLMSLQICREELKQDPQRALARLASLEETARRAMGDMRRLINDLRPPGLDDMGVVSALKRQLRELSRESGVRSEFQLQGEEIPLSPGPAGMIFRIMQEALANVGKHAQATSVRLVIGYSPRQLRIELADDGKGFSPEERGRGTPLHFGLLGMRERAEMLDGTLDIRSGPGRGTVVTLTVPMRVAPTGRWEESARGGAG